MSFDSDESSVQDSRPDEGYKIELPLVTYYLASGVRDVMIGADLYTATTISRGAIMISGLDGTDELEVSMHVSHPVAQRYLQDGIPPRAVLVTVYRKQPGGYSQWKKGYATAISVDGLVAKLRIPSLTSDAVKRKLPTVGASRTCPHQLYDTNCRVDRSGSFPSTAPHKQSATVAAISGVTVTVPTLTGWTHRHAELGELVHTDTGERRSIYTVAEGGGFVIGVGPFVLTIQMPIVEMLVGDAIDVYAGCNHRINSDEEIAAGTGLGCREFVNVVNFGGQVDMPVVNPFQPGALGWVHE